MPNFKRLLNSQLPIGMSQCYLSIALGIRHESAADHRLGLASNPVLLPERRQLRILERDHTQISAAVDLRDVSGPLHPYETQDPK